MDINQFYLFDVSIWGTVSDWAMVVVTSVSAIFLIKTFKSQRKVQIMQQSITDIEKERYRIEYRPEFEITTVKISNKKAGLEVRSTIHFRLNLVKNEARVVEIISGIGTGTIERILISKKHEGLHMPIPVVNSESEYNLHLTILADIGLFEAEGAYFSFSLIFKDTIGNAYRQPYTVSFKDDFSSFYPGDIERVFI